MKILLPLIVLISLSANAFDARPMLWAEDQRACEDRIIGSADVEIMSLMQQRVQAQSDSQNFSLTPEARKKAYFKALNLLNQEKLILRLSDKAVESGCGNEMDYDLPAINLRG